MISKVLTPSNGSQNQTVLCVNTQYKCLYILEPPNVFVIVIVASYMHGELRLFLTSAY